MSEFSTHPIWQDAERQLLRAERLVERSVEQLQAREDAHLQERARIGLEIERALQPLQALSAGLGRMIESMVEIRQDNRIQRWQGELQELLTPVDEAEHQLQELLLQLEQPGHDHWQGQDLSQARPVIQRLQLQQLLARRQRQVQQLQAELRELRAQSWATGEPTRAEAPAPESPAARTTQPSIFS